VTPSVRRRVTAAAVALLLGVLTAAMRLLALVGFPNDQFASLTPAAQILIGDWPVRDFVDAGAPLTYIASAIALAVGGRTLLSEAVLVALAFGLAAALTVVIVLRWTGSLLLGIWAAVVELIAYPRPYSYPKILLYVAAAGAVLAYAEQPGRWRRLGLGTMIATAFLFRHDHGLYIGVASLAAVAILHAPRGWTVAVRECARVGAYVLVLLLPFIVYVQMYAGWSEYVAVGLDVSRVEAERTLQGWPNPAVFSFGDPDQYAALLYYAFWVVAFGALVMVVSSARSRSASDMAVATAVIALAMCTYAGFLRDPMDARIPDVIVPVVLLLSWIAKGAFSATRHRWLLATPALVLLAAVTIATARVGRFEEQVDRSGVYGGIGGVRARAREVLADLRAPYVEEQMPSDFAFALVPFYEYVQACTPPHARLFVTGFAPEVPFFARRGFAGGLPVLYAGFHSSSRAQQQIVRRLDRQLVPFVVVPPDRFDEFERLYPEVNLYVARHYVPLTDVPVDGAGQPSRIFVRRELKPAGTYGPGQWPCFERQAGD
jgi:hypothetical protein